jgi:hypothetical protein
VNWASVDERAIVCWYLLLYAITAPAIMMASKTGNGAMMSAVGAPAVVYIGMQSVLLLCFWLQSTS